MGGGLSPASLIDHRSALQIEGEVFFMDHGFPIAIVLLVMVAGFLILRLRSVLGKRTGFERPPIPDQPRVDMRGPMGPMIDGISETTRQPVGQPLPPPYSPTAQALGRISAMDRRFDPAKFIEQAETAFRQVVTAFAQGDLPTLRDLLTPTVFSTFEQAIAARNAAGEIHTTEIKAIVAATIDEAEILGDHAAIVVRFVSDQINLTRDKEGNVIAGTEAMTEMVDLWTFERNLKSADPVWRLAAARSG